MPSAYYHTSICEQQVLIPEAVLPLLLSIEMHMFNPIWKKTLSSPRTRMTNIRSKFIHRLMSSYNVCACGSGTKGAVTHNFSYICVQISRQWQDRWNSKWIQESNHTFHVNSNKGRITLVGERCRWGLSACIRTTGPFLGGWRNCFLISEILVRKFKNIRRSSF